MSTEIQLILPSGKDYLSPSSSKELAKHPQSYLAYINDKFAPNYGMIFGQYYEDLIYGVDTSDRFFIYDDNKVCEEAVKQYSKATNSIRSTNVYKELKEAALECSNGKYILSEEDHDRALKMANIMTDSHVFDNYLNGTTQVTKDSVIDTGKYIVKVLVRSDVITPDGQVNDLKTTSDELGAWLYATKSYGYDIQAYLSMEVHGVDEFSFVVQRTKGIYDIAIFTILRDSWYFENGRKKFNKAVDNYVEWLSPEAEALGSLPQNYVNHVIIE